MTGAAHRRFADLYAFLAGRWTVRRHVRDRRRAVTGTFEGIATFDDAAGGLRYVETGELRLGDYRGPATQTYTYLFPAPWRAEVLFRDGRPFHALDLRNGIACAVHDCGDDRYRGRYVLLDEAAWLTAWRVRGPHKDQFILTRYRRA